MRTAFTSGDDVERILREAMHRSRTSFKQALNTAIRAGLGQNAARAASLPFVVVFGFVRLATHAGALRNPMTQEEAAGHVRWWLEQPPVQVLNPGRDHIRHTLELLETLGTAGNLVSDAQMAGLAINHDAVLHAADADFVRFPGLR